VKKFKHYVGIDWATEEHAVCVLDAEGNVVDERIVHHTGGALNDFIDWLTSLGDPREIAVAIETTRGAVVEGLLERDFEVFSINPKQLDRFRDRHTVAGAKDDRRDAYVLADSLRTDLKLFRRLAVDEPAVVQLRELVRSDDDLMTDENRLGNRIREHLLRYYPQMTQICKPDEAWFWALFELAPTPDRAAKLKEERITKVLRQHRIRRITAPEVLAALKVTPLRVAPGVAQANARSVARLIERMRVVVRQRKEVTGDLKRLLETLAEGPDEHEAPERPEASDERRRDHRDVAILLSFAGLGTKTVATMIAEAWSALAARDYLALRSLGGSAPVTKSTGKRKGKKATVTMRRACNPFLRNALYHWSRVAVRDDPSSRAYYAIQVRRGVKPAQALRAVADRNLRILMAMLRTGTLYDPARPSRQPEAMAA
jgi:endonuclease III